MPSRYVRDGILTSDRVNALDWGAEVFYRRLMSVADDYGRFDGRLPLLRSAAYPLKTDTVALTDVAEWLAACCTAGLVTRYSVEGKDYIEIQNFGQRVRSPSKYPDPPMAAACEQPSAPCGQMTAQGEGEDEDESEGECEGECGKSDSLQAMVSKILKCRIEFRRLRRDDIAQELAAGIADRKKLASAVDAFCRTMVNSMKLPDYPLAMLRGYIGRELGLPKPGARKLYRGRG